LTLIGTRLEEDVPFVGKSVKEAASIFPDVHFMPVAIQRKGTQTTLIPEVIAVLKLEILFFL
jgi:trk system potassium uptake protein TrkA